MYASNEAEKFMCKGFPNWLLSLNLTHLSKAKSKTSFQTPSSTYNLLINSPCFSCFVSEVYVFSFCAGVETCLEEVVQYSFQSFYLSYADRVLNPYLHINHPPIVSWQTLTHSFLTFCFLCLLSVNARAVMKSSCVTNLRPIYRLSISHTNNCTRQPKSTKRTLLTFTVIPPQIIHNIDMLYSHQWIIHSIHNYIDILLNIF